MKRRVITSGFFYLNSSSTPPRRARPSKRPQSRYDAAVSPRRPCHSEIWHLSSNSCSQKKNSTRHSNAFKNFENFPPSPPLLCCSLSLLQLEWITGPTIAKGKLKIFVRIFFFIIKRTCRPSLLIAARIAAGAQMSHFFIRVTCT